MPKIDWYAPLKREAWSYVRLEKQILADVSHHAGSSYLSECDESLLINGGLFDQLLVLPLQVFDSRAGVPEEDHFLAHRPILLLQAGDPLVVVIQLGVADLGLLPQSLVLFLQKLLVFLQLGALLLQCLVLGEGASGAKWRANG